MKRQVSRPEGVDAKIERAKRHLAVVKREVRAYEGSHPEYTEAALNPTLPGYDLYSKVSPPSIGLSVKIGDFLFNLRSALDHLARGLVEAEGNNPVDVGGRPTAFPILTKKPNSLDISGGVDPNALSIVERIQPYSRPGGKYWLAELWTLNELNNIDKHRTLHFPTVTYAGPGAQVVVIEPGPPLSRSVAVILGRVENGEKLGNIKRFSNPDPNPTVEMHGQFTVEVLMPVLGPKPRPSQSLVDGMQELLDFVRRDVVPSFDLFFR